MIFLRLTWIEKESHNNSNNQNKKAKPTGKEQGQNLKKNNLKLELEALEAQKPIKLIIKSVLDILDEISELHLGQ